MRADHEQLALMSRGNGNTPGQGRGHRKQETSLLEGKETKDGASKEIQGRFKVLIAFQIMLALLSHRIEFSCQK